MIDTEHYIHNQETKNKMDNLYNQAQEQNLIQKYGDRKIQEATLKIAARQNQEMIKNISDLKHYNRHGLEKQVRKISRKLDAYPPQYKPHTYLEQFKPEVNEEVIIQAESLLDKCTDIHDLIGVSTTAKAAAAVYIAGIMTENYLPNEEIVAIGDVSEPTLRKTYRIMVEQLDLVDQIMDKHPYPSRTRWANQ